VACSGNAPRATPEAAGAASGPAAAAAAASALEAAAALGVPNAHEPAPGLLTAGQITEAQLDGLARAGYTTFVSLRLSDEEGAGWEEAYASGHGVTFTRIPVAGAEGLTRENVEALDRVLDAAGNTPVVVYCGSANRAGALLALRARWLDGATPEEALAFGRAAGMTRLEPVVAQLLGSGEGTP
jgi:uncharacterized protein (TIGR01244 family)